jgi:hypothetical protein
MEGSNEFSDVGQFGLVDATRTEERKDAVKRSAEVGALDYHPRGPTAAARPSRTAAQALPARLAIQRANAAGQFSLGDAVPVDVAVEVLEPRRMGR